MYLYRPFRAQALCLAAFYNQNSSTLIKSKVIYTYMFRTLANMLLAAATATLCWQAASGVPARRGAIICTQPDGTTITVERMGDEHFHTFVTADDRIPVQRTPDGQFRYLNADGTISGVAAHNPGMRTQAEAEFLRANAGGADFASLAAAAAQRRQAAAPQSRAASRASQVPFSGSPRVPILLVSYSDVDFLDKQNAHTTFERFFNTGEKSALQYFSDQSNGAYTPQFDVYGPIKLSGDRATYGGNAPTGGDKGIGKMVAEACTGLASEINFKDYDNNNDGECDVVIVLYAGVGEASSDVDDAIWPCQWDLRSSDYRSTLKLNGVTVNKFAVFNEQNGQLPSRIDGIGTFCHEFSHCLGLPDFYETSYMFGYFGMDAWSIMHYGCYNDYGDTPLGYSAYEKNFLGWVPLPEAVDHTYYTLPVWNQKNALTDQAIRITNPDDTDEYFVIENRARQGWDRFMEADGLLIYRVAYDAEAWYHNTVNNNARQRMTPIPADNKLSIETLSGDLWPYGTATELTSTSTPATILYNGSRLDKPVTNMTRNSDGTISFWFVKPETEAPVLNEATAISSTGFTASWQHASGADMTYTLRIEPHYDIAYSLLYDLTFNSTSAADWTRADNVEWAGTTGGVKLGSAVRGGSITSPEFTLDGSGIVTVKVAAKRYALGESATLTIALLDASGREISTANVKPTSNYSDYIVTIEGEPYTTARVQFATREAKQRIYLMSTQIYTGDATAPTGNTKADAPAQSQTDGVVTITGITATSHTVTGLQPATAYDFRVKAEPKPESGLEPSTWSRRSTVTTLPASSAITAPEADAAPAETEYFNLQGVRISADRLTPGIYVRRTGTTTEKIIVR